MNKKILLIEDDASGRELALFNLKKAGYIVEAAANGSQGLDALKNQPFDLVVTDVEMPGISGIDVLKEIKKQYPSVPVIIITAYANVEMAVEAMKLGAEDFLGKPFGRDHLLLIVKRALEQNQLRVELNSLRIAASGIERPIIYCSKEMSQTLDLTDKFAKSDASVLITGQSGTGKELIARRIHVQSPRAAGPFVPVNLAAVPAELVESELFGHSKGAFTGATTHRTGKFRQASGGTIFLDEIAELPMPLQGKLLRVLQEKVVDSLGSDTPTLIDVRVVAATNRDLEEEIKKGNFRSDLFYRVNVVQVPIPKLSQRTDDIEPLTHHFIQHFALGRTLEIPEEMIGALKQHSWPGNIRELENVCQRLVLLAPKETVRLEDLPFSAAGDLPPQNPTFFTDFILPKEGLSLVDLEKSIIEKVLTLQNRNVSKAAIYLKIPRHILAYRMEKFGIPK